MKNQNPLLLLLSLLFIIPTFSKAQIGLTLSQTWNEAPEWRYRTNPESNQFLSLIENGYTIGLDYEIELHKLRLQLVPQISYSYSQIDEGGAFGVELRTSVFAFEFHTKVYPFNFLKEEQPQSLSYFKQNLFFQISPGVNMMQFYNSLSKNYDNMHLKPSMGAGLGLDIPLSNKLKITPIFAIRYTPNAQWKNEFPLRDPSANPNFGDTESELKQYFAGIRIGI